MKKWIFAGMLSVSVFSVALADTPFKEYDYLQNPLNLTIHISDVKSHSKDVTNEQCQFQVKDTYQVYTNKIEYDLDDAMKIKMGKVYVREEKGMIVVKGSGVWYGISPTDAKPFADVTHFVGVGLKGDGKIQGVLSDDYCQAKFMGEFAN